MKEATLDKIIAAVKLNTLPPDFSFEKYVYEPTCGVIIYRRFTALKRDVWEVPVDTKDGAGLYHYLRHFVRRWKKED